MDEVKLALEYIEAAFAVVGQEVPMISEDKPNVPLALGMCAHWAAIGKIASLKEWHEVMNPKEPHPWPAGTRYPD